MILAVLVCIDGWKTALPQSAQINSRKVNANKMTIVERRLVAVQVCLLNIIYPHMARQANGMAKFTILMSSIYRPPSILKNAVTRLIINARTAACSSSSCLIRARLCKSTVPAKPSTKPVSITTTIGGVAVNAGSTTNAPIMPQKNPATTWPIRWPQPKSFAASVRITSANNEAVAPNADKTKTAAKKYQIGKDRYKNHGFGWVAQTARRSCTNPNTLSPDEVTKFSVCLAANNLLCIIYLLSPRHHFNHGMNLYHSFFKQLPTFYLLTGIIKMLRLGIMACKIKTHCKGIF